MDERIGLTLFFGWPVENDSTEAPKYGPIATISVEEEVKGARPRGVGTEGSSPYFLTEGGLSLSREEA